MVHLLQLMNVHRHSPITTQIWSFCSNLKYTFGLSDSSILLHNYRFTCSLGNNTEAAHILFTKFHTTVCYIKIGNKYRCHKFSIRHHFYMQLPVCAFCSIQSHVQSRSRTVSLQRFLVLPFISCSHPLNPSLNSRNH